MKEKETTIYDFTLRLDFLPATLSRGLKDHPALNKATKKKIFGLEQDIGYRSNNFASYFSYYRTGLYFGLILSFVSHLYDLAINKFLRTKSC